MSKCTIIKPYYSGLSPYTAIFCHQVQSLLPGCKWRVWLHSGASGYEFQSVVIRWLLHWGLIAEVLLKHNSRTSGEAIESGLKSRSSVHLTKVLGARTKWESVCYLEFCKCLFLFTHSIPTVEHLSNRLRNPSKFKYILIAPFLCVGKIHFSHFLAMSYERGHCILV